MVGVSWHEARAYCAWLSAQTDRTYRLPTEYEWEAAARGQARRPLAYDGPFDPAKGNTYETRLQRTTPVGVFPEGDTPEGISDLAANIADWTSSPWVHDEIPQASAAGDDALPGPRVICGAGWTVVRFFADASRKQRGELDWRNAGIGFRVVCVSPSGAPPTI